MKLVINGMHLGVIAENTDPKFYGTYHAKGESQLLHHIRKAWNSKIGTFKNPHFNFKLIKKRMWKDGCLVDDLQQYLRSEKPVKTDENGNKLFLALWNTHWAICGLNDDFNKGSATLQMDFVG